MSERERLAHLVKSSDKDCCPCVPQFRAELAKVDAKVDRLRADLAEARRVIARTVQIHQVVGAYCPLCPGDDAAEQPNCPHRARACGTCKSSRWPCPTFAALTAEGTDRTEGDEQ